MTGIEDMNEQAIKLQQDLEKKFDQLCFVHDQTALYVANQFYELRNQIDIDAEELLARYQELKLDDESNGEVKGRMSNKKKIRELKKLKNQHKSKMPKTTTRKSKKKIEADFQALIAKLEGRVLEDTDEDVKVNNRREEFIKILRELEQRCLNKLQKTNHPSSAETYCHFKQRIESLKECPGDRLEETYRELALELVEETYQLEKRLIGEEIVFFVPGEKKLGHLVHIGGDRLRRHEVECLREMTAGSNVNSQHEIPLRMHLATHLKKFVMVEFSPETIVDNNFLIVHRLVHHMDQRLIASNSKYIYMGIPELQYSDNTREISIIEKQFVDYRLPNKYGELRLEHISGITSELGLLNFVQKNLHFIESKFASLDFLASPHASQLETLIFSEIRLERFDENLISRCVNLKNLKIDVYGEGINITSLEFLRPLRKLSAFVFSLLNFDIDLSVLQEFRFLSVLTLCGGYDSSGKLAYPKMNIDAVLRQLSVLPSLTSLQFLLVEIDKVDKHQFATFKALKNVTFYDTRGCKEVTESFNARKSSRALSALDIRFIPGDTDLLQFLLSLL